MAKTQTIFLCTPSLGMVSMWWARQLIDLLRPQNLAVRVCMICDSKGDEIAETRNKIVNSCLLNENEQTEVHSLMWIDDDVLVSHGVLVQLYNHHVPIASGVYFTKCEPSQPLICPGRLQGTAEFVPNTIMKNVWGHGMGLCLIKGDVYKHMLSNGLPKDKYGHPEWYKTNREFKMEGDNIDCGGTEDLHFLHNASKLGYSSIVDCSKFAFGWHYDARRQKGFPEKQFTQWSKAKPIEWETKEGVIIWE